MGISKVFRRSAAAMVAVMGLAGSVWADNAAGIKTAIDAVTGGNNLAVNVNGSTVTVTGALEGVLSTGDYITLNIDAGVTVRWQATLKGQPSGSYALININGGSGTFQAESGTIENTGTGRAITNNSACLIRVQGSARISSKTTSEGTIFLANSGTATTDRLIISGGTVENTSSGGEAISNRSTGAITVSGGTVSAVGGYAIYNYNSIYSSGYLTTGTLSISGGMINVEGGYAIYNNGSSNSGGVTITGGTIKATTGRAIYNDAGTVSVSGGTVSATTGRAIYNSSTVTISGNTTKITSAATSSDGTIYNGGTLNINAGTVENTGTGANAHAIYSGGTVNVSNGTVKSENGNAIYNSGGAVANISGGTVTTNGSGKAAIYISGYTSSASAGVKITGGTVSTTQSDGYAVYYDYNYQKLTLGGNPTITGRIYAYSQKISVITAANDPDIFAPATGRIYTLDFPANEYAVISVAVINGSSFLNNFILHNSGWALSVQGQNLNISTASKVTFDLNGGTGTPPNPVGVVSGKKLYYQPSTNGYTKSGYHNGGKWCTNTTGATEFLFGDNGTTVNGNMTLYLKWIQSYTVTFNANGGSVSPASRTTSADSTLASLPTPTRTGYTFNGWYTAASGGTSVAISRKYAANATIYAQWILDTYTVTFNPNGGTVDQASGQTLTASGSEWTLASLPTPARDGYFFEGWFTASSGGTAVATSREYTANTTIFARWSPVYTVAFDVNGAGGTVDPASAATSSGSKLASLPTPTRNGYFFEGWFTDGTGGTQVTTSKVYTENATIYAQWSPVYTVEFDANDGTVDPASAATSSGSKLTSLPTPARMGYGFVAWFTEKTGGTQVTTSKVYTENTTIYAQWNSNVYIVNFNLNGGAGATPANITGVPYNSKLGDGQKPSTAGFTRSGYVNDGKWYTQTGTSPDFTYTEFLFGDGGTPVTAATTLYLKWTPVYTVSFNLNGGTGSAPASIANVLHSCTLSEGQKPSTGFTRSGYVNDGRWYTRTGTTEANYVYTEFVFGNEGTQVTAATTLYLKWTQTYAVSFDANVGGSVFNEGFEGTNSFTVVNDDGVFLSENFEGTNSFTMLNGTQTNKWAVGTATANSGSRSAYISNDNGTSNAYTITSSSIVHMYRVVTFPVSSEPYTLSFNWKGMGEASFDYLSVHLTSTYPTAGTAVSSGTSLGTFRGNSSWQQATVSIPASNSNTAQILVFTWRNDASAGTAPPIAVDNISIRRSAPNRWYIGNNVSYSGSRSAYIATASGTTNSYTNTITSVVHMYRDVTFPAGYSFSPYYNLSFNWKGMGEASYDYLSVHLVETSVTPAAGTAVSGTLLGTYQGQSTWQTATVSIPASNSGTTKRLVFTWRNNASGGTAPPIAVDNIALTWGTDPVAAVTVVTGGTLSPSQIPLARDITRGGYVNDGKWYIDAAGTTEFAANSVITGNMTLYLKWAPANTYAVDFNLSGGSGAAPSTVYVKLDNTVFREDFEGTNSFTVVNGSANRWYVGTDTKYGGTNSAYIATSGGTANSYTLASPSTVHIYRDVTLLASAEPCTLSFYWKGLGEADYDYLSVHLVDASTTISSGIVPDGLLAAYRGSANWQLATIIIPASNNGATKRLVFTWRNDNGYGEQPPIAVDNIVLKEAGYGSGAATVTPPSTASFAKTGYYIDGNWYTRAGTEEDGYEYAEFVFGDAGTKIRDNTTVYLNWLPRYKVSFDLSGGSGTTPGNIYVTPPGGSPLGAAQKPSTSGFTRTGYFFQDDNAGKWYVRTGTEEYGYGYAEFVFGENGTPVTGDVTLYLIWTPLYRVSFDLNGGSEAAPENIYIMPPGGGLLTGAQKPSTEGFTRTGYFIHNNDQGKWYTRTYSDVNGYEYTEFVFGESGAPITGDVTLYLKWTPLYKVSFYLNGGSGTAPDNVYVTPPGGGSLAAAQQPSTSNFTRAGYFLQDDKWYTLAGTSENNYVYTEFVFGEDGTPVTGDVTLYLKWAPLHNVSFDSNGGSGGISYAVFIENFEGSAHSFTAANGSQTNKWAVGTAATTAGGSKSAYISNDGGTSNAYRTSVTSVVHLYRTVTFPVSSNVYALSFDWKGMGESDYDDLKVYLTDATSSITAGTTPAGTLLGTFRGFDSWQQASVSIPASNSGATKRLVFSWRNNSSGGTQPPIAVDNIVLTATGATASIATNVLSGNALAEARNPSAESVALTGYAHDGKWYTRSGTEEEGYEYTEFVFGENGTPVTEDVTLYLKWTPVTYEITYELNGGAVSPANPNRVSYNIETPDFTLTNPARTGYTFAGWTGANGTPPQTTVSISLGSTGNRTYTANWTPITYTITYDLDGGTVSPANRVSYNIETPDFALNNPAKTGYTFSGWMETNGTTAETTVTIEQGSTGDKAYTANWTINTYTITFNANGGEVTPASGTTGEGWKLASLPTPTKSGYTFDGWYNTVTSTSISTRNVTVAIRDSYGDGWNGSALRISVNGSNLATNATISSGSSGTYTFNVVSGDVVNVYWVSGSYNSECAFAVYYTDTPPSPAFNPASGASNATSILLLKRYGELSVTGGTLLGSFTVPTNTVTTDVEVTANTVFSADAVINAKWTVVTYAITYDLDGGAVSPANIVSYNITTAAFTLRNPDKAGYTFAGWTGTNGTTPQTSVSIAQGSTGDRAYTANWTLNRYIITLDANGGSVTPESDMTGIGWMLDSLPTPTRNGYTFKGWFTTTTGSVEVTESRVYSANAAIYAQWTPVTYAITYDLDGGSVTSANPASYNIATAAVTLTNPTKTGYMFAGWTGTNGETPQTSVTVAQGSTGGRAYTANWTLNRYIITFNANGGTVTTVSDTTGAGWKLDSLPTPTQTGYTFNGWYTAATGGTVVTTSTVFSVNNTIYAQWTQNLVSVLTPDRVIPQSTSNEEATVIAPVTVLSGEFTAGPNPVSKRSGIVNFYRQGRRVAACELYIYDATGNIINKVKISDNVIGNQSRRIVGKWDLTDRKGRQVSEGAYLVKGVVKTSDGKSEKVSVIVGVR